MSTQEALSVMAQWVAAIADNVKNPIAGIAAVLDVAESRLHDPALVGTSLAQVRGRLAELNEYVSELADFARPAVVLPAAVRLDRVVSEAIAAAALPDACVVEREVPAGLSAEVDAAKLALVVKALLRNGLEAVDAARTPRLRIAALPLASGRVSLVVEDNGPGLDAAAAARAFEPFFSTKEAGTGLGLAVARKYVEAHGGAIAIDRSPGLGGCRVVLTLPGVQ